MRGHRKGKERGSEQEYRDIELPKAKLYSLRLYVPLPLFFLLSASLLSSLFPPLLPPLFFILSSTSHFLLIAFSSFSYLCIVFLSLYNIYNSLHYTLSLSHYISFFLSLTCCHSLKFKSKKYQEKFKNSIL